MERDGERVAKAGGTRTTTTTRTNNNSDTNKHHNNNSSSICRNGRTKVEEKEKAMKTRDAMHAG